MKLRHIEVFHALMTSSNMTEAAERLHVSQPAVSQVLKHAEQTLGLTLFHRSRGRLVPTPEAMNLLPEVEDIFNRLEALERSAQGLRSGSTGSVTVAAVPAVASFVLPRVLATSQVQSSVREWKSDFGIINQPGSPLDVSLQSEVARTGRVFCVIPRAHALAKLSFVGPEQLADYPLVTFGPQSELGAQISARFAAAGVSRNVRIESSSSLAGIFMVASGLGVALVESSGMVDHFPELVEREFRPHIETALVLVERGDRPKSRLAIAFRKHLTESLRTSAD
jgi:DNA-binding transcriptional LysR family regulator